jgi:hypothetical protein
MIFVSAARFDKVYDLLHFREVSHFSSSHHHFRRLSLFVLLLGVLWVGKQTVL